MKRCDRSEFNANRGLKEGNRRRGRPAPARWSFKASTAAKFAAWLVALSLAFDALRALFPGFWR